MGLHEWKYLEVSLQFRQGAVGARKFAFLGPLHACLYSVEGEAGGERAGGWIPKVAGTRRKGEKFRITGMRTILQ